MASGLISFITEQNRASALREFARKQYGEDSPQFALAQANPDIFNTVLGEQLKAQGQPYSPQSPLGKLLMDQQNMGMPVGVQGTLPDSAALAGGDVFSQAIAKEMAPTAEQAAQKTKDEGKVTFDKTLQEIAEAYDKLNAEGGVVNKSDNFIVNAARRVANSEPFTIFDQPVFPGGQTLGRAFGTEEQSLRNIIAAKVPLAFSQLKNVTGMSAQQLNSNVELQQFLKAFGSLEGGDYDSNKEILKGLSETYGAGGVGAPAGGTGAAGATGKIYINPQTGQKITKDPKTNKWVPVP